MRTRLAGCIPELTIIRRAFAKQVVAAGGVRDPRVEAAFAAVAREDFLGPGPWQIVRWGAGYRTTPDPDPVYRVSSPPAFGRPTLDETVGVAAPGVFWRSRRQRGRFFHGAEEPAS